ncbi:MAG: hypothetical protein COA99_10900, partial [Moraxellaceae bacterium]
QLAHKLSGGIDVKSEFGIGSEFTLYLDLSKSLSDDVELLNAPPVKPSTSVVEAPAFVGRVLYVEDDFQSQQFISEFIRRAGCRVDIANDGLEGLAIASNQEYDLILADINVPRMNGIEFAAKILEKNPNLPIISITANPYAAGIETAGFCEVLSKPISSNTLYKTLAKYLPIDPSVKLQAYFSENPDAQILVVEDDLHFAEILKDYLSPFTELVTVTLDCDEASALIAKNNYDFVITDLNFPNGSGLDVVNAIKKADHHTETKILCVTGAANNKEIEQLYAAGVNFHLTKPVSSKAFLEGVGRLIDLVGS